jgi:cytochrome c
LTWTQTKVAGLGLGVLLTLMPGSANANTGKETYAAQCSMCHQTSGSGLTGQFPRLSGRTVEFARTPESRRFLVMVLLYGMYGKIVVDDKPLNGVMPTMGMLSDQKIADVLNHTLQLVRAPRPPPLFTAAEVSKVRAAGKRTSADVAAERVRLVGKGLIPK